ncbi:MAG: phosphotransferase [Patescibacteria group bacterium]|nr:phosphotransferase [Patescibacteria group bacterium]
MYNLKVHKKLINRKVLAQALEKYLPKEKIKRYKIISRGWDDINIEIHTRTKHLVLRFYSLEKMVRPRLKNDILYCLEFMEYLGKNEIPTPKIYRSINDSFLISIRLGTNKHFVSLSSFVPGKNIENYTKDKIRKIARLQAGIHKLSKSFKPKRQSSLGGMFDYKAWYSDCKSSLPTNHKYKSLLQKLEEYIKKSLASLQPGSVNQEHMIVIHGDISNENLHFLDSKIAGIFDFEDCHKGTISEDIGCFFSSYLSDLSTREMQMRINHYFEAYRKVFELVRKDVLSSLRYCILKWAVTQYYFNTNDILEGRSLNTKENKQHNKQTSENVKNLNAVLC